MLRSISLAVENVLARRLQPQLQPQLCGIPATNHPSVFEDIQQEDLSTWFAVPKQKISKSKKRKKQFHKNHFKPKENITRCRTTGEVTLTHKLPFNWKDYIPDFEYEPAAASEGKK